MDIRLGQEKDRLDSTRGTFQPSPESIRDVGRPPQAARSTTALVRKVNPRTTSTLRSTSNQGDNNELLSLDEQIQLVQGKSRQQNRMQKTQSTRKTGITGGPEFQHCRIFRKFSWKRRKTNGKRRILGKTISVSVSEKTIHCFLSLFVASFHRLPLCLCRSGKVLKAGEVKRRQQGKPQA